MLFRTNSGLVSVLCAAVILPHLLDCGLVLDGHHRSGVDFTRQQQKKSNNGIKESIRLLSLGVHENLMASARTKLAEGHPVDDELRTLREQQEQCHREVATQFP